MVLGQLHKTINLDLRFLQLKKTDMRIKSTNKSKLLYALGSLKEPHKNLGTGPHLRDAISVTLKLATRF